jgi:hypothetical protein
MRTQLTRALSDHLTNMAISAPSPARNDTQKKKEKEKKGKGKGKGRNIKWISAGPISKDAPKFKENIMSPTIK